MKLNPTDFNRFIGDIGQNFYWRKAYMCPCVLPDTHAPDVACAYCHGKGVQWQSLGVMGIAGVPNANVVKEFSQMGEWESGDMLLTIPSNSALYKMGERDRVTMQNSAHPFSINLRRAHNDRVPWTIKGIDRVFWMVGNALVEGSTPTQQPDGTLAFARNAPPDGVSYSVTGTRYAEFFVYRNFPVSRGHHLGAALPVKVQLRAFDLFGR